MSISHPTSVVKESYFGVDPRIMSLHGVLAD